MLCDTINLPDNASELKELVLNLQQDYEAQIDRLHEQIRLLRSKLFGRKAEKYVEAGQDQLPLFDEIEQAAPDKGQEEQTTTVSSHKRKKPGCKPLPEDLARIEVVHDLPDEEKVCACGCQLTKIGEEVSEFRSRPVPPSPTRGG